MARPPPDGIQASLISIDTLVARYRGKPPTKVIQPTGRLASRLIAGALDKRINEEHTSKVTCGQSDGLLPKEDVRQATSTPCSSNGPVKGRLALSLWDALQPIHDSPMGKVKDPTRSSKDNPRIHFFTGVNEPLS